MTTKPERRASFNVRNNSSFNSTSKKRFAKRFRLARKGITQIDYIIAAGVFILVFALVVQFVSNYFSNIGDKTNIRVMTDQARQLLDAAERGPEPVTWPYDTQNASLVLMMHLDNSTLDGSQYGNNGTITGGANCSAAVVGRLDSGCSFDGVNDYIDVADSNSLDLVNEWTIMAWVKRNSINSQHSIVEKYDWANGKGGYSMRINSNNKFIAYTVLNQTLSDDNCGTTSTTISNGTWYHVAATFDTNTNTIICYVNGVAESTNSNALNNSLPGDLSLRIGARGNDAATKFNGSIDEVLVYNRTLSANEIYNHYAYENLLDKIGLASGAYEFYITVNDTLQYARNQTAPVVSIASEKVIFNYTDLGYGANVPSTAIYEDNGSAVPYSISGNIITFSTAITAGTAKYFTVYFDDDSNFAERTSTITGADNLTEIIGHVDKFPIIQYRKLLLLNNSNYFAVKNATGLPRDFNMQLVDIGTNATILNFGPASPRHGNVVAFQRYATYQNSTSAINRGRLVIQSW